MIGRGQEEVPLHRRLGRRIGLLIVDVRTNFSEIQLIRLVNNN
jgi:hypothetical protein